MRKNKHIFLLGALFFIFALVKYAFMPDQMPTSFIIFEVLSFLVVLYIIYYILNFFDTCMNGANSASKNKECIQRQSEVSKLKAKLEALNKANSENSSEQSDHELLVRDIKNCISDDQLSSVNNILNVLKKQFELMVAIAYTSNSEKVFQPIKSIGVDEEVELPAIDNEEGLHGQAIADNKAMEIEDVPSEYLQVGSGIGEAKPCYIYILPLLNEDKQGLVVELASFKRLDLVNVWNKVIQS
ncbi:GAF domain-containing protein [Carboxylicivirga sp. M1479]|uniref:GAF domain-containing protein n=1 Tax=Carboxylicivirga sp. M1479 TaxID=2594476 RepID=UPI0011789954|nr:GAF domain-containing protein [Carboxylicivirga sp. M1479]TRX71606.1 GAF domain-containing protein [Carboxylicivirga sp. M1479]